MPFFIYAHNPDIEIYHCTQFDCPYKTFGEVMKKLRLMKKWQVGARIFGLHTENSGRPYYEEMYDQINTHLRGARQVCEYYRILPGFQWDTPFDIARQADELVWMESDETCRDAWQIYEKPKAGTAYFMSVDTAEGSEDESQEQDRHAAHIFRPPVKGEPDWPVQVATLDTGLECDQFAPLTLYGCAAYNNCMLAPEAVGKSAGIYLLLTRDWPFKFTMVITNDITKKQTEKYGFFTMGSNRTLLFDLVGNMMKDCAELPMFGLRGLKVLKQISGTIVGRGGRPDHKKRRRNDSLMSLGIGYYVYRNSRELILDHSDEYRSNENLDPWASRIYEKPESRPVLGSRRGLDSRKNVKNGARR